MLSKGFPVAFVVRSKGLAFIASSAAAALLQACAANVSGPEGGNIASAPPPAPVYALSDILGEDPQAIDALLGAPALTRREGSGEYRRYALTACTLIVIVYPDDAGAPRAAHVDAAALRAGEAKPDLDACLAAG